MRRRIDPLGQVRQIALVNQHLIEVVYLGITAVADVGSHVAAIP